MVKNKGKENKKRYLIYLDESLVKEIKEYLIKYGGKLSGLCEYTLREWLRSEKSFENTDKLYKEMLMNKLRGKNK